mgnify:CR=1 FL=1
MNLSLPRIEISLSQIQENAQVLSELYKGKGISLMGVTKAVLGEPSIAKAMIQGGVKLIADSRIENIIRMKNAGISIPFVLLAKESAPLLSSGDDNRQVRLCKR